MLAALTRGRFAELRLKGASPNDTRFGKLAFPRTARMICGGTVYIKNKRPPEHSAWVEADEVTAASFFLHAEQVSIQK